MPAEIAAIFLGKSIMCLKLLSEIIFITNIQTNIHPNLSSRDSLCFSSNREGEERREARYYYLSGERRSGVAGRASLMPFRISGVYSR